MVKLFYEPFTVEQKEGSTDWTVEGPEVDIGRLRIGAHAIPGDPTKLIVRNQPVVDWKLHEIEKHSQKYIAEKYAIEKRISQIEDLSLPEIDGVEVVVLPDGLILVRGPLVIHLKKFFKFSSSTDRFGDHRRNQAATWLTHPHKAEKLFQLIKKAESAAREAWKEQLLWEQERERRIQASRRPATK